MTGYQCDQNRVRRRTFACSRWTEEVDHLVAIVLEQGIDQLQRAGFAARAGSRFDRGLERQS
jgi:hypothetical protein